MYEAHFLASYFEVKDFFCLNLSIGQRTLTSFLTAALSVLKKYFLLRVQYKRTALSKRISRKESMLWSKDMIRIF